MHWCATARRQRAQTLFYWWRCFHRQSQSCEPEITHSSSFYKVSHLMVDNFACKQWLKFNSPHYQQQVVSEIISTYQKQWLHTCIHQMHKSALSVPEMGNKVVISPLKAAAQLFRIRRYLSRNKILLQSCILTWLSHRRDCVPTKNCTDSVSAICADSARACHNQSSE